MNKNPLAPKSEGKIFENHVKKIKLEMRIND